MTPRIDKDQHSLVSMATIQMGRKTFEKQTNEILVYLYATFVQAHKLRRIMHRRRTSGINDYKILKRQIFPRDQ